MDGQMGHGENKYNSCLVQFFPTSPLTHYIIITISSPPPPSLPPPGITTVKNFLIVLLRVFTTFLFLFGTVNSIHQPSFHTVVNKGKKSL